MQRILLVLCFILPIPAQILQTVAATSLPSQYVSQSAGSDSNDGLSEKTAWQTLAKVNAATLLAGNTVGIKSSDTWRETLTPGQSGNAGAAITFTSYGSGTQPQINGANLITGWSADTGTSTYAPYTTVADLTGSWNFRMLIPANTFSGSGTAISIVVTPNTTTPGTVVAFIGQQASSGNLSDMTGVISQFLFGGSSSAHTLVANTPLTSDTLMLTYDQTKTYVISLGITGANGYYNGGGTPAAYFKSGANGSAGTAILAGMTAGNQSYGLTSATLTGAGVANVWNATDSTQPYIVAFNGTTGTIETSKAALTGANEWFWGTNTLSVYSTSNPTSAYTSPGIEAGTRLYGVNGTKNYTSFSGLEIKYTNARGVSSTGTNAVISGDTIHDLGGADGGGFGEGVLIQGANSIVNGNSIYKINRGGIDINAANSIVVNNTLHDNWNGVAYPSGSGYDISVVSVNGSLISRNNLTGGSYFGIFGDGGGDMTVTYNTVGPDLVNELNHTNGVSGHPNLWANNTVIHNPSATSGHGQVAQTNGDFATFQNNLIYVNYAGTNTNVEAVALESAVYTTISLDYNLYYLAAGSTATTGELVNTQYSTLANWQTALAGTSYTGKDVHSVQADPLFVNFGAGNFNLQSGSPAIAAGIFISGVSTANPPNIGAK